MLKKKIRTLTYYQQPKLQRKNCRNPLPALNLYLNSEMISQTTTLLLTSLVPRWCWCFSNAYRILHVHFFPVTENFWKKDVLNLSTGSVSRHSHKPLLDPKTHEKKQVFSPKDTGFKKNLKIKVMGSHGGWYSQVLFPKTNSQIDRLDPGVLLCALIEFPLGAEIGAKQCEMRILIKPSARVAKNVSSLTCSWISLPCLKLRDCPWKWLLPQKERIVFQPWIFRCYVSFRGGRRGI